MFSYIPLIAEKVKGRSAQSGIIFYRNGPCVETELKKRRGRHRAPLSKGAPQHAHKMMQLLEYLGLTDGEFAQRLGTTDDEIWKIHRGKKELPPLFRKVIAHEYQVQEEWWDASLDTSVESAIRAPRSLPTNASTTSPLGELEAQFVNKLLALPNAEQYAGVHALRAHIRALMNDKAMAALLDRQKKKEKLRNV